ncbi:hypothetical protein MTO96_025578 [Rhipicephalus appendiculatus]
MHKSFECTVTESPAARRRETVVSAHHTPPKRSLEQLFTTLLTVGLANNSSTVGLGAFLFFVLASFGFFNLLRLSQGASTESAEPLFFSARMSSAVGMEMESKRFGTPLEQLVSSTQTSAHERSRFAALAVTRMSSSCFDAVVAESVIFFPLLVGVCEHGRQPPEHFAASEDVESGPIIASGIVGAGLVQCVPLLDQL